MSRAIHVTGPRASDWHEIDVPDVNSLETLQGLVGGLIEALPIDSDKATVWLNEEGKIHELPPSCYWMEPGRARILDILMGPLVLQGPADDEGNITPLTDEALAYIKERVKPLNIEPRCGLWEAK